jgi:hypothetical protein
MPARLSDRAVFTACLGGLVAGIGLFLVLPLAPKFLELHQLPTTRDFDVEVRPQGQVTAFWVVSMASFALAVWQWRRGRRPSWALLLAGVAVLHLLALLVPPVASKDVYAYSFYGKVQTEYGANPYLSFPDQHPTDPWHSFWSWRLFGPVYGPPFLLLLRLMATVAGPSLLTWVVLSKLVLVAAELAAIWLLVRALQADPTKGEDPRWPLLLIGWNPMVLQSFAMSAHVDALLLLVLAGAVLAHRRGRHLLAFLLLVGCFLIKVYMGPLAALYAIWLATGRPRLRDRVAVVAGLGLLGTVLTALVYLPYASAGSKLFTSAVDVSGHFSSGSPPNLVRRLLAVRLARVRPVRPGGRRHRGPAGPPAGRRRHPGRLRAGRPHPAPRRRPVAGRSPPSSWPTCCSPLGLLLARGAPARHRGRHPLEPDQPGRRRPVHHPGPPGPGRPPGRGTAARGSAARPARHPGRLRRPLPAAPCSCLCLGLRARRRTRPPTPTRAPVPPPSRRSPARRHADAGQGRRVVPVAQDPVELGPVEGEEAAGLLQPVAGRGVRPDGLDALFQVLLPANDHGLAAVGHLVPGLAGDLIVVAPLPRLTLASHQAQLHQVADRAGDRGRAHPQGPGEVGGGGAPVVGAEDGREHPRRHAGHARLGQVEGEPLDEPADPLLVAPGIGRVDHQPLLSPVIARRSQLRETSVACEIRRERPADRQRRR